MKNSNWEGLVIPIKKVPLKEMKERYKPERGKDYTLTISEFLALDLTKEKS